MTNWTVDPGDRLVYGAIGAIGHGVVVPERYVHELRVLLTPGTWGGLREQLGEDRVTELVALSPWDGHEAPPTNQEPYSPEEMDGWDDGDYPDWAQQRMLDWLPEDLVAKYVEIRMTAISGEYVEIAAERMDELALDLEARGFRCWRDDALVTFVSKYGDDPGTL